MVFVVYNRKQGEVLRKHGVLYAVRLNNKKDGKTTIYFKDKKIAKGKLKKVEDTICTKTLEKFVHLSGFKDAWEWLEYIDRTFLYKGLTPEGYNNLAIYEVKVIEWFDDRWFV